MELRLSYALPKIAPATDLLSAASMSRLPIESPRLKRAVIQDALIKVTTLHTWLKIPVIAHMLIGCDNDVERFIPGLHGERDAPVVDQGRLDLASSLATHFPKPSFSTCILGPSRIHEITCALADEDPMNLFSGRENVFEEKRGLSSSTLR